MQISSVDKRRTATPRWRAFDGTPTIELQSISTKQSELPWHPKVTEWQLNAWRKEASLEASVDLFDYGVVTGDRRIEVEGAAGIISRPQEAAPRLLSAAKQSLSSPAVSHRRSLISLPPPAVAKEVYSQIRILKRISKDYARNSLIHCELARLYARTSQFDKAEQHILIAVSLDPHNRYVLRCLTNFFSTIRDSDDSLKFLRRSDGFSSDPWVQSAELAASQLAGRSTMLSKRKLRDLRSQSRIPRQESELAAGVALLEHDAGVKPRQLSKLIRAAIYDPTENALAQSMWVNEQAGGDIEKMLPQADADPMAWEARASALFELGEFARSEEQASLWLLDQPLELRASLALSYVNLIQLQNYHRATDVIDRAVEFHPSDWSVQNCAVLTHAYSGDIAGATEHLKELTKLSDGNDEILAFAEAAKGLVSYFNGDPVKGADHYLNSVRISRRLKRYDYIVNAAVFWLEREVFSGYISPTELEDSFNHIDRAIKKLPISQSRDINHTYLARQKVMREASAKLYIDQPNLRTLPVIADELNAS